MKKYFNENKKVLIPLIAAMAILVVGVTYAWLTQVLNGTQVNRIKAGVLELTLDDKTSNGIDLEYAVPQSDEQGLTNIPYTFKVINNGTINAEYKLYLEDEEIEGTKISDSNIKYSLVRNGNQSESELLSTITSNGKREIENTIINAKSTYNYTLRLWIDSETKKEEIANKVFKAKIKLEAVQTENDYEDTYEVDGYLYDNNDNIVNTGSIVVFSNPKYSGLDESGKLEINRIVYGKHSIYYVPAKTLDELKNLTEKQINQLEGVGKGKLNTYDNGDQVLLDNGYIIKGLIIKASVIENNEEFIFDYTGSEEEFRIPANGKYKLEVWGAQGGTARYIGGKGGYSYGEATYNKGTKLYINVGGRGQDNQGTIGGTGGYNGGGSGGDCTCGYNAGAGGGGATHIATATGQLKDLVDNKNSVLLVAGGGGGGADVTNASAGAGGGISGTYGRGYSYSTGVANQTTGYQFGQGQNGRVGSYCRDRGAEGNGGGGGGYYGGYAYQGTGANTVVPGGGGSGYINGLASSNTETGIRTGNGYAKITYLGK